MEKRGRARYAADYTVIGSRKYRICLLDNQRKYTDTHSQHLKLLNFHGKIGYGNAFQCYLTNTLSCLCYKITETCGFQWTELVAKLGKTKKAYRVLIEQSFWEN